MWKTGAKSYDCVFGFLPDGLQSGSAERRDEVSERFLLFSRRRLGVSAVRRREELRHGDVLPVRVGVGGDAVVDVLLVLVRKRTLAGALVRPGVVNY